MIISNILGVILDVLGGLFAFLPSLPSLSPEIMGVWQQFVDIVYEGMSLVGNFLYLPVALPCLLINLSVHLFLETYNLIAWFVNKIPFIGIKM